jgi:type II secretory pathway pseudopilin PulG
MKDTRVRGFTIVELLVAVIIFVMTITALVMAFSTGLMAIRAARETSTAVQVAQQEIEDMRNTPFNGIATHGFPVPSLNTSGTVVIEPLEGEDSNMKKASVNVSWTSGSVRDMIVNLVTIITKDGI